MTHIHCTFCIKILYLLFVFQMKMNASQLRPSVLTYVKTSLVVTIAHVLEVTEWVEIKEHVQVSSKIHKCLWSTASRTHVYAVDYEQT